MDWNISVLDIVRILLDFTSKRFSSHQKPMGKYSDGDFDDAMVD